MKDTYSHPELLVCSTARRKPPRDLRIFYDHLLNRAVLYRYHEEDDTITIRAIYAVERQLHGGQG